MNVPLIIVMVIAILLLFVSMILAATAAADITDSKLNDDKAALSSAYSFATWSAVASGISIAILGVALALYVYFSWDRKSEGDGTKGKPIDVDAYRAEQRRKYPSPNPIKQEK